MTYEERILAMLHLNPETEEWTTQSITERTFECKKGDTIYNNHIEDVTKDMQRLKRDGWVTGRSMDTGRGYYINVWRLNKDKRGVRQ